MRAYVHSASVYFGQSLQCDSSSTNHNDATFECKYIFFLMIEQQTIEGQDVTVGSQPVQLVSTSMADSIASILMPPPALAQNLPPGCPTWAARLKNCEVIF